MASGDVVERDEGFSFSCSESLGAAVQAWCAGLGVRDRIRVGQQLSLLGDAVQTAAAAELVSASGDTRAAQRALGGQKMSKRAARRQANRAAAASKNGRIADKMATGALSGEQVDALVAADRRTGGSAAVDDDLIDALADTTADQTPKVLDDYVSDHADADTVQAEHDRQRSLRNVSKHRGRFGLAALTVEGDEPSVDAIYKQLTSDANRLYPDR